MKYVDIMCVGGPWDGNRRTGNEETFDVLNSGPSSWKPLKPTYELVALDMKLISMMFYKDITMTMEQALTNLVEGYNPRGNRRY